MSTIYNTDKGQSVPGSEFYDSLGANYETAFGHDPGLHRFIDKVISFVPPQSRVLDVGSGTGTPVARTIASHGHHITGIDIAPSMIALSRAAVPSGTFEVANMLEYVPKEPLNAVINSLSLFQLSRAEMEVMCAKWATWLIPGGVVCICTIPAESVNPGREMYDKDGLCARGLQFRFMGQNIELMLMTKEGWKVMLERAGFEIVFTEEDLFVPPEEAKSDDEMHYYIVARKKE